MSIRRNMKPIRFATVIFAATALIGVAQAQSSYSCVNDAPNPYKQVTGWANMPRAWAATNNVFVDGKDNVWVMDRCEDKGCQGSHEAPIWELSPRSEEHTSELQSRVDLVCRLLPEKKRVAGTEEG